MRSPLWSISETESRQATQCVATCECLKGAQREERNLVGIKSNVEEKARLEDYSIAYYYQLTIKHYKLQINGSLFVIH